jgi:hypothetical protein
MKQDSDHDPEAMGYFPGALDCRSEHPDKRGKNAQKRKYLLE